LHAAPPVFFPSQAGEVLADADVILSLDWFDLAGTLAAAGTQSERCVIHASVDLYSHRGWSMDYQGLPPVDIGLLCASDQAVAALLDELPKADRADRPSTEHRKAVRQPAAPTAGAHAGPLMLSDLGHALAQVTKGLDVTLTRVPIGWPSASWPIRGPLDYIGGDGGGGVGGGLGISIGAALALLHSGRIPVGIVGDGDYIMGVNAMWTAAHCRIPLLIVVANNHSFYVDELHQETIARQRSRPTENKWIGQRIEDPRPDLAGLARAQGVEAIGPVENWDGLVEALAKGVAAVRGGAPFVVDVSIQPGYEGPMAPAIARAMARK
jgi:thiamine pyrophosphate-dependent acetolactate synthase large subunit-like protein